ncbi:hypothetical protein HDV05_004126 [Chytridiales sp. JEL 0842]|nr:hypothetical protein HDV05_004126 [Chytridiales sp. JEL 0842]
MPVKLSTVPKPDKLTTSAPTDVSYKPLVIYPPLEFEYKSEPWKEIPVVCWSIMAEKGHEIKVEYMILTSVPDSLARIVKTAEMPPTKDYILCVHPHGLYSLSQMANITTNRTKFNEIFPGITPTLTTLKGNFYTPGWREFLLSNKTIPADLGSLLSLLKPSPTNKPSGKALSLVVGGGREFLHMEADTIDLVLKNRKGFVKLALMTGSSLVPVLCFGENELYERHDTAFARAMSKVTYLIGRSHFPVVTGQYGTLFPKKTVLTTVFGPPIDVELADKPTQEQIDELHRKYVRLLLIYEEGFTNISVVSSTLTASSTNPQSPDPKPSNDPTNNPIALAAVAKLMKKASHLSQISTTENTTTAVPSILGDSEDELQDPHKNSSVKANFKTAGQAVLAANTFGQPQSQYKGITPAQALTRLTGTIFDFDADVPTYLQGPLVTIVTTSDTIQKSIDAIRPQFEILMHWEALMASLYVTFSLWATWVIGHLGLGYGWVIILILTVGGAFKRDLKKLKRKLEVEASRKLAVRRLENETETVEWVNKFLQRMWVQMEPGLSESLKLTIDGQLSANKPGFLEDLSLSIFTLGSTPPRIESIRTINATADDVHIMDWDLNFTPVDEDQMSKRQRELGDVRNSRIEIVAKIGKGIAVIPLPIVVGDFEFKAQMRIGFKYMSKFPHIKTIEYSFLTTPKVDFILRPLKALDMMDLPGLSNFLSDTIGYALSGFVEPHKNYFDMDGFFNGTSADCVSGVLRITLYEAKDLKNQELAGVSDPYARVIIGGKPMVKTSKNDGTLNPFWGETYYVPIMKSMLEYPPDSLVKPDELQIKLFDYNNTLTDKQMGATRTVLLSRWIKLLEMQQNSTDEEGPRALSPELRQDNETLFSDLLTPKEREMLMTEWGTPFDEMNDVWKDVYFDNDSKSRGQVRLDMAFFPYPKKKAQTVLAPPASPTNEALPAAVDPKEKKRLEEEAAQKKIAEEAAQKAAEEALLKLRTGVLTITVHQAKELPCSKNAAPICYVDLSGVSRPPTSPEPLVGTTPVRNKTNNPVWDHNIILYIEDTETAECTFTLRDNRDSMPLGAVLVKIKDVINLPKEAKPQDWFKLSGVTGKLRLSFKWEPLDLETAQGDKSKIQRKEPIGMIKVKVIEAKGVANVETFRKSDPYTVINLSSKPLGATHVKENTLDPVWNETFYGVCYSLVEPIKFDMWDYNNLKKDRTLGRVEFLLNELLPREDNVEKVDENGEIIKNASFDLDLKREAWLSKNKMDGWKVKVMGDLVDVWAPIYIFKSAHEEADDVSDATQSAATASKSQIPATTTRSSTGNIFGNGAAGGPKQKGYLHFEIEYYKVKIDSYVRADTLEDYDAKLKRREEAESELRKFKMLRDLNVKYDREKEMQSLDFLACEPLPHEVLENYPSGILRLRIHQAKDLLANYNAYIDVVIDDEVAFSTRAQKRTNTPVWNASKDICMTNLAFQKLYINVRDAQGKKEIKDDTSKSKTDPIVAFWKGNLESIVGHQSKWITVHDLEGREAGQIQLSTGYAPIEKTLSEEASMNTGVVYVDILDAHNLEAVDSSGTSDPYCIVSLNDAVIHKSKVHKKNLNPVFNETITSPIQSRLRANINITVKDYNTIGKHTTLGTVSFQLAQLTPNELLHLNLPLEGARGGVLRLRMFFDPQSVPGDGSSNKSPVVDAGAARVEKAEEKAFTKLSKGIGNGAITAIGSIGKSLEGAPKQSQTDVTTAEEMAKLKNAKERVFGAKTSQEAEDHAGSFLSQILYDLNMSFNVVKRLASSPSSRRALTAQRSVDNLHDVVHSQRQALVGTVSLTIHSARDLKPVDDGGTSDPYVKVTQVLHGKVKTLLKTKVIKKSLNPVWQHETVTVRTPPSQLTLLVKDKNTFSESKALGEAILDLTKLLQQGGETPSNSFDVWLPLGLGGTGDIRVLGTFTPDTTSAKANDPNTLHVDHPGISGRSSPVPLSETSSVASITVQDASDDKSANTSPSLGRKRKPTFSFLGSRSHSSRGMGDQEK